MHGVRRFALVAVLAAAVFAGVGAGSAMAAAPTITSFTVDGSGATLAECDSVDVFHSDTMTQVTSPNVKGTLQPGSYEYRVQALARNDLACAKTGSETDSFSYNVHLNVGTVPPPVNTALPAISGTPVVGQTLTCSNGSWDNN